MAASIYGETTLKFGCPQINSLHTQSAEATITRDEIYAQDEEGSYKALAIPDKGKCTASGEAIYNGTDIATLNSTVTIGNAPAGYATVYCTEISTSMTNTGFMRTKFKAAGVEL